MRNIDLRQVANAKNEGMANVCWYLTFSDEHNKSVEAVQSIKNETSTVDWSEQLGPSNHWTHWASSWAHVLKTTNAPDMNHDGRGNKRFVHSIASFIQQMTYGRWIVCLQLFSIGWCLALVLFYRLRFAKLSFACMCRSRDVRETMKCIQPPATVTTIDYTLHAVKCG